MQFYVTFLLFYSTFPDIYWNYSETAQMSLNLFKPCCRAHQELTKSYLVCIVPISINYEKRVYNVKLVKLVKLSSAALYMHPSHASCEVFFSTITSHFTCYYQIPNPF